MLHGLLGHLQVQLATLATGRPRPPGGGARQPSAKGMLSRGTPGCAAKPSGPVYYRLGGLAGVLGQFEEVDRWFSYSMALSQRIGVTFSRGPDRTPVGIDAGPTWSGR